MSRILLDQSNSQSTKSNEGPIRWMAPESLREKTYSSKSDVYMFGVALWEVLTREIPYQNYPNLLDVYEAVLQGERLIIPEDTPPQYHEIMIHCWLVNPD